MVSTHYLCLKYITLVSHMPQSRTKKMTIEEVIIQNYYQDIITSEFCEEGIQYSCENRNQILRSTKKQ